MRSVVILTIAVIALHCGGISGFLEFSNRGAYEKLNEKLVSKDKDHFESEFHENMDILRNLAQTSCIPFGKAALRRVIMLYEASPTCDRKYNKLRMKVIRGVKGEIPSSYDADVKPIYRLLSHLLTKAAAVCAPKRLARFKDELLSLNQDTKTRLKKSLSDEFIELLASRTSDKPRPTSEKDGQKYFKAFDFAAVKKLTANMQIDFGNPGFLIAAGPTFATLWASKQVKYPESPVLRKRYIYDNFFEPCLEFVDRLEDVYKTALVDVWEPKKTLDSEVSIDNGIEGFVNNWVRYEICKSTLGIQASDTFLYENYHEF